MTSRCLSFVLCVLAWLGLVTIATGQDDCSTATSISGVGTFPFDTTGHTTSGFNGSGACPFLIGQDTFLQWTATADGTYSFDTCGTAFDTRISLHNGTGCAAQCYLTNDDACDLQSSITVAGLPLGSTILIQIGGFDQAEGPGVLNVSFSAPLPSNNTCAGPTLLSGLGSFPWDNSTASTTNFGNATCGAGFQSSAENDVFFVWNAPSSGDFFIETCGSGTDSVIVVYEGSDCTATCVGNSANNDVCVDDDLFSLVGAGAGTDYLIQVGGWFPTTPVVTSGVLTIGAGLGLPTHNTCAAPEPTSGFGTTLFQTDQATTSGFDGNGLAPCAGFTLHRDLFWTWTATTTGPTRFSTTGSSFNTRLAIHAGADCTSTCIDWDDNSGGGTDSSVDVPGVVSGDVYLVQVGGWGPGDFGAGQWTVGLTPAAPGNDDCSNGILIAGTGAFPYDTSLATTSGFDGGDAAVCSSVIEHDVFYDWTATTSGDYRFSTCGTPHDTILNLHSGVGCGATCVGSDDDACAFQSTVTVFGVLAGERLLIQVGGFQASTGPGVLEIGRVLLPTNDSCATPEFIVDEGSFAWDNTYASTTGFDGGDPSICMSPLNPDANGLGRSHRDLFWALTVPCPGDWQVDTEGSTGNLDTRLSIHAGSDCSATCLQADDDSGVSPRNSSASVIAGALPGDAYLIQVGSWSSTSSFGPGLLNITRTGGPCTTTASITITCDPAQPHYAGGSAKLDTSAFGSGTGSGLRLECTDGPAGEFGFFLVSATATSALSVFNGILCLDNPMGRYSNVIATNQLNPTLNSIGVFDGTGVLQNLSGTSASGHGFDVPLELPYSPVGQVIQPGDTWAFQLWFRDQTAPLPNPGSSANFSNAVEVTFP
tara:strand:+ start:1008 stop:3632 length:2625 start_codon:yes stop_codon:yes gene_type:complete